MEHLVRLAVRYDIYIYIYVIRWLKVNFIYHATKTDTSPQHSGKEGQKNIHHFGKLQLEKKKVYERKFVDLCVCHTVLMTCPRKDVTFT